jgi:hypothetical protein
MLVFLKALGKWGASTALIISIPIAHGDRELDKHIKYGDEVKVQLFGQISDIKNDLTDLKESQREAIRQINFIYRRELEEYKKEKK